MKHFIIVKWKDAAAMASAAEDIRRIFSGILDIDGIHGVTVHESCTPRPNRYDIMIEIDMDQEALPAYDVSAQHHEWKDVYGEYIASKAIFDHI